MPLYEYRCEQCSKQFEATQSVHARIEDTECPFCHAQRATRLLSSFSSKIVGDHKPGFTENQSQRDEQRADGKVREAAAVERKTQCAGADSSSDTNPMTGAGSA